VGAAAATPLQGSCCVRTFSAAAARQPSRAVRAAAAMARPVRAAWDRWWNPPGEPTMEEVRATFRTAEQQALFLEEQAALAKQTTASTAKGVMARKLRAFAGGGDASVTGAAAGGGGADVIDGLPKTTFHILYGGAALLPLLAAFLYVQYLKATTPPTTSRAAWTNKSVLDRRLQAVEESAGIVPDASLPRAAATGLPAPSTSSPASPPPPPPSPPPPPQHHVEAAALADLSARLARLEAALVAARTPPSSPSPAADAPPPPQPAVVPAPQQTAVPPPPPPPPPEQPVASATSKVV